ncbi:MAG: alanine--tRNA ligase-related protein [Candidatus Hodgkinia cicadicola]
MTKSFELKRAFLEHFASWGHTPIPSFPVRSSRSDLLFNNSGMAPLHNMFYGASTISPLCNIQRCVRLGGKHNDYANIGVSRRHLSLFEMMGGFSFGNYSKLYAIALVWEFLIKLGLNTNKIVITAHANDLDTVSIWNKIAGPGCKLVTTFGEQNVWKAGSTGLCGACTEVYYVNNLDLWEILNIVFITHTQHHNGCKKLTSSCIDIGIGLERMLAVLDNHFDVYLIDELKRVSELVWPNQRLSAVNRILLDHVRCAITIIADGVLPSNTGAGYVLRKLIRRCVTELLIVRLSLCTLQSLFENFFEESRAKVPTTRYSVVLDVFFSEVGLCLKSLRASTIKLSRFSSVAHCYDTFGMPEALLQVLVPSLFKRSQAVTYYDRDYVKSKLLLERANYLVLDKTSLRAAGGGELGDCGVLVGIDFGFIINRGLADNEDCHKVLLSVGALSALHSKCVWVIRNPCVFELCSYYHSNLHVLIGVLNLLFERIEVMSTKVSCLGFALELNCVDVLNTIYLIQRVFPAKYRLSASRFWYIKHANKLIRFVSVGAFGLSFIEKCRGAHISLDFTCEPRLSFERLSLTRFRVKSCFVFNQHHVEANFKDCVKAQAGGFVNKTEPLALSECYYPLARAPARLRMLWVSTVLDYNSYNSLGLSFTVCVNLTQKAICCSSLASSVMLKAFSRLTVLNSSQKGAFILFNSHLDLSYGLIFIRSAFFLLNLIFEHKSEQKKK